MPPPEEIKISWTANPPGQIGIRPREVKANTSFIVTSTDPGIVSIEFKGKSPLADGSTILPAGATFVATHPGSYKFKCHLKDASGNDHVLDPDDPNVPNGGGEMKVLPPD